MGLFSSFKRNMTTDENLISAIKKENSEIRKLWVKAENDKTRAIDSLLRISGVNYDIEAKCLRIEKELQKLISICNKPEFNDIITTDDRESIEKAMSLLKEK